ncbi:hypothetical protein N7536_004400 [Penicillium majusculum]|uniref:Uncharacterized protein n=1 Tax=Penicillium solitum TaxID=60172 RepID=A0A1V6R7P6_9EURO|nr:uncharacterized protein PENSOL_c012G10953 [Penicillium solitum]KAJ5693988.1 hypothetical protein N7536_004400 [Penicillium majusculum]OQD97361.1 hypothetical protein PENSOL_c012G10953 [Penicillium solitum]
MSTPEPKSISILGLGQMGHAIASNFVSQGFKTFVWNRTPSKAADLVEQGAIQSPSSTVCIRSSPLSILCVNTDDIVMDILAAAGDISGHTIVNIVNGSPQQVRKTAERAISQYMAAGYLHGSVMASPGLVRSGGAMTIFAGSSETFKKWELTLQPLGTTLWLLHDVGAAPLYDCSLLSILSGIFSGFMQALAMIGAAGHSETEFARGFVNKEYVAEKNGSPIAVQLDSTKHIFETAKELGVSSRLLQGFLDVVKEGVERGQGREEISGLVRLLREPK